MGVSFSLIGVGTAVLITGVSFSGVAVVATLITVVSFTRICIVVIASFSGVGIGRAGFAGNRVRFSGVCRTGFSWLRIGCVGVCFTRLCVHWISLSRGSLRFALINGSRFYTTDRGGFS